MLSQIITAGLSLTMFSEPESGHQTYGLEAGTAGPENLASTKSEQTGDG